MLSSLVVEAKIIRRDQTKFASHKTLQRQTDIFANFFIQGKLGVATNLGETTTLTTKLKTMNADDPNTSRADKPNDAGLSVHKSEHRKYSIPNKNAHKEYANILEEIKNSPKNTYFKYSKKFKPAKLNELGFQFDFSLFNSNCPYYPNALDDINTKINRDRSFWKAVL